MAQQPTIIIIGGAHGGPTAASMARQFNEHARIILVEKAKDVMWVQADLRHHLEGNLALFEKILKERDAYFRERYQIEVRHSTEAIQLDMDARCVLLRSEQGQERVHFDSIVFAGGAVSKPSGIDNLEGPCVANFRNLDDIRKIKSVIHKGAKKAVVIGCGQYGIDAAEGLRVAGLQVEVVEKAPRILPRFSLQTARSMVHDLKRVGTQIHLGMHVVKAISRQPLGFALELSNGEILQADLVVVTIGSRPRTELLAQAGAAVQKDGSLRVDAHMATTLPNVYACGSAVSVPQVITHERQWLPQPSVTFRTAQVAGYNAAAADSGNSDRFQPVPGTQLFRIGDVWYGRTGLTQSEARKLYGDDKLLGVTVHGRSMEVWSGSDDLAVHLLVDRTSQAIVGGEVWGKNGVARRLDLLAMAITAGLKPDALIDLDMSYSSELGTAFDVLKEAAMLARLTLLEQSKLMSSDKLALWYAEKKTFTLIDVSRESAASEKLPVGARVLPLEELRKRLHEIDKRYPVVVSSQSGRRAFLAQRLLQQKGFDDVYHLDGGTTTWSLLMS